MVGRNKKRLIRVTGGNLRNSHLYVNGHHDFFPRDCVGGAKRAAKAAARIEIALDGLNETVTTVTRRVLSYACCITHKDVFGSDMQPDDTSICGRRRFAE